MIKFLTILLVITFSSANLFAQNLLQDGFYVGVDAAKNDEKIGKIDNSVAQDKTVQDKYYGYKFSGGGFFLAPEVSVEKNNQVSTDSTNADQNQVSLPDQTDIAKANASYGLKANVGYDFNQYFSGFVTYDVAKFSYNPNQGVGAIDASKASNNSTLGFGSQINISDSFGVKVLYSQQQFDNNSASGGKVRSDIIKVGTVYSF
jgi:hypothetical protein